jgi:hypothetical protein
VARTVNTNQQSARSPLWFAVPLFVLGFAACDAPIYSCPDPSKPCGYLEVPDAGGDVDAASDDAGMDLDSEAGP